MSTAMAQGFENQTTGTQRSRKATPPSTPTAASKPQAKATSVVSKALEAVKALRATKAQQQTTDADATKQEETTEQVADLRFANAELTIELTRLNKEQGGRQNPRGSIGAEEIRNNIDRKTTVQTAVKEALKEIEASNHSAYVEGTRRYNFRQEALEMADSNRRLLGSATAVDIRGRIAGAVEAEFMVVTSDKDEMTVSFDKQSYNSVLPNDASVSDVAASLKELVEDLQDRKDSDDQVMIAELHRGGFYISARRDPDATRPSESLDSELDLLRREPGLVRKASEFLTGNSGRYIARVGRGFMVLEHRDSKFVAVKTSDTRAGRALFTVPDRATSARVARKSAPEINNSGTTVTASDLSGVWYDPLRLALEEDLRRETESAERRETADGLRDVSQLENPLTLTGIAEGEVGTSPVSISYEDPETGRRHTVTFQVAGDGTKFSVTGTVPGTKDVIKRVKWDSKNPKTRKVVSSKSFLPDFIGKETPVAVLETDPMWRDVVRPLNREFERDWQLAREAEQRNAVPVTAENLDGLTAIEGTDGAYAVRATIRDKRGTRENTDYVYKSVGYIVERKGSKVEIVWAVTGTSAAFANDLRGELEIGSLPWRARLILGNVFWTIRKTDAPEHLRLSKKQEADNTTEK